mmetsp:Transcript_26954/g.84591  ORF Transcript_26954/g.84591 Transcript_26954/m.84591 type:complete len:267 (-) Transcript_26954:2119-2919(-)
MQVIGRKDEELVDHPQPHVLCGIRVHVWQAVLQVALHAAPTHAAHKRNWQDLLGEHEAYAVAPSLPDHLLGHLDAIEFALAHRLPARGHRFRDPPRRVVRLHYHAGRLRRAVAAGLFHFGLLLPQLVPIHTDQRGDHLQDPRLVEALRHECLLESIAVDLPAGELRAHQRSLVIAVEVVCVRARVVVDVCHVLKVPHLRRDGDLWVDADDAAADERGRSVSTDLRAFPVASLINPIAAAGSIEAGSAGAGVGQHHGGTSYLHAGAQ